ncbi:hypothetical protein ACNR9Q_14325 [Maribacter sp. X9]|uniref:hypothetical protein n=1 Tax=Maribacter sp. X9 TaxID=3402159 RepID=UPI003AF39BBC
MRRSTFKLLGYILVAGLATLTSCESDDNQNDTTSCNVKNPVKELDWLREAIAEVEDDPYSFYVMAAYKGKTVFYYGNCNPVINYASTLMNCNGDSLGYTADNYDSLKDITVIWNPEDSVCDFDD